MTKSNRRTFKQIALMAALTALVTMAVSAAQPATYVVTVPDPATPLLRVKAVLPCDGTELLMDRTRPGDMPRIGSEGWPAVISDLQVSDGSGGRLQFVGAKTAGWKITQPCTEVVHLTYSVDLRSLAAAKWPAPREAGFADASHLLVAGRSIFVTTQAVQGANVRFILPKGWQAIAPWTSSRDGSYLAPSRPDLVENLLVFTRDKIETIRAGNFSVTVTSMGAWRNVHTDVERILAGVIPQYVRMFGSGGGSYSVVLLPMLDDGGEAYRSSFAYTYEATPSRSNDWDWGETIAHEVFHRWNGYALAGTDYASSQWFQEGFTDYAANDAMLRAGVIDDRRSLDRLSTELTRYSKLTTPLAHPGTHKGPPLYGGGALVALCWDILVRDATDGRKTLRDLWPLLWQQTDGGKKAYTWIDINAALDKLTPYDWNRFYQTYIDESERLPLADVLPLAGLRVASSGDRIEFNPTASGKQLRLRRSMFADGRDHRFQ
jgi:predicted metalloprotease with PDZ domain